MRFVSPLLKRLVYPAMHRGGWLKRIAPSSGCAVVNYHGVLPHGYRSSDSFFNGALVAPEDLQKQLRFLKRNYAIVGPEDFLAWIRSGRDLPPRSVLITCDDGLANPVQDMLPVLQSEGLQALFFVTGASSSENPATLWYEELYQLLSSGQLQQHDLQLLSKDGAAPDSRGGLHALWWNAVVSASKLSASARADRMNALRGLCSEGSPRLSNRCARLMNIHQLRQLTQAGMSIGAHSMSHPVLSECDDEDCNREIAESKATLERVLGASVWAFAYPFGNSASTGAREVRLARGAGFECAFLNMGGGFSARAHAFTFPRTHITSEMSVAELEARMIGFHARLQDAVHH